MASPAFWGDNRRAQELIRERSELARGGGRRAVGGDGGRARGLARGRGARAGGGAGAPERGGGAPGGAGRLAAAGGGAGAGVDAGGREGIAKLQRELVELALQLGDALAD